MGDSRDKDDSPGAGSERDEEARLLVLNGNSAGRVFTLASPGVTLVGRHETCEIRLLEEGVSRRHFSVAKAGADFRLEDLGSSNGTFVNGEKVASHALQDQDRIHAGPVEIQFRVKRAPAKTRRVSLPTETTIRRRIEDETIAGDISPTSAVELERNREMLRTLYRVGNLINAETDREKIFETIMDIVLDVLHADRGYLLLWDKATETFERAAMGGPRADQDLAGPSRSILRECVTKGLSILSTDTLEDERFKSEESIVLHNIRSALSVPLESKRRVLGALYLDNLSVKNAFSEYDLELLSAIGKQAGIAVDKVRLTEENERLFLGTIRTLVATIEAKDHYTRGHTERVTAYATELGRHLDLSARDRADVRLASLLHDVGKIGIPESILTKPGRLTEPEFEVMKRHPVIGAEIAGNIDNIERVRGIVLAHHERWDGTGYPGGLTGEEIPLGARILAVADAYDAMTSSRTYRRNFSREEIVLEFQRCAGSQFDRGIVEVFLKAHETGHMEPPDILDIEGLFHDDPPS